MVNTDSSMLAAACSSKLASIVIASALGMVRLAGAVCYTDGSDGFPLVNPFDPVTGLPQCAQGFSCPGFDPEDPNTFPRYCPPTQECSYNRAMGNRCSMPQGSQEPFVCPPGYYCPDATSIIPCPEGHYCPMAAYEPIKCLSPSYCPAGTVQQLYFGGIIFMAALFLAVLLVMLLYKSYLSRSRLPNDYNSSAAMRFRRLAIIAPTTEESQEEAHPPLPKSPTNQYDSYTEQQQVPRDQFPEERSFGRNDAGAPGGPGGRRGRGDSEEDYDSGYEDDSHRHRHHHHHHTHKHGHHRHRSGEGYRDNSQIYAVPLARQPSGPFVNSVSGQEFAQRLNSISTDQPYRDSLIMNPMIGTPRDGPSSEYDFNEVQGATAEPFAEAGDSTDLAQAHVPAMSKPATQLLAGAFRRARGTNRPLHIKFEDLRVLAPLRQQPGSVKFTANAVNKRVEVLKGVNGELAPSRVTAVLGPGGCGKTVFLNALLGRLPSGWSHTGHLSINNETSPSTFARLRPMMGYVSQVERLHKELTVYENLFYNAQVRLPRDWTNTERQFLMSAIVDSLKLSKQKDMPIGDEETRGISGGQRRRTHIGVELAGAPWCLILDEPTNGLDSTTALEVCSCLSAIATGADLTVVMTISQPRVEIWNALDDVLILAKGGRTVYQGKQKYAEKFFSHFYAVSFKADANPADVIIDEVSRRGGELADMWEMFRQTGQTGLNSDDEEEWATPDVKAGALATPRGPTPSNGQQTAPDSAEPTAFIDPSGIIAPDAVGQQKNAAQEKVTKKVKAPKRKKQRLIIKYERAPFLKQIYYVHNRSIAKQLSDIRPFLVEQVVNLLVAAVLGVSLRTIEPHWSYKYYQLAGTLVDPILPQVFMYASMALGLVCATPGLNIFLNDRDTYFREAASGFSKPAYYLGSILASQVRIFITAMTFTAAFHIVPRLYVPFWPLFLPMYLNALCSYALGGIAAMHFDASTAPLVSYLAVIFAGCLSGFIKFPMFMKYLSYEFYNSALLQRVFVVPYDYIYNTTSDLYGWPEFAGAFGLCVGVMLAYFAFFHLVAFILMVALHRDKQR